MFKKSLYASLFVLLLATTAFAQKQNFPELYVIQVSASWCAPCQKLDNQVLTSQTIKSLLRHYKSSNGQEDWEVKPYYVNFDDKNKAEALGVKSVPTLLIMDDNGNIYNEIGGTEIFSGSVLTTTHISRLSQWLQNPYKNENKTPIRQYRKPTVEAPAVFND